jgi:hypothetical protein
MKRFTARWTIAVAAATVLALPISGLAQTPAPAQPPAPSQEQEPAPRAQPPMPQQGASQDSAKIHLTAARNALSELTQLPAASQLQGDARNQVSQLINNFNELITTQNDWKAAFAKVEANLATLITPAAGVQAPPASGTPGAVGTSGTTAQIDPAIRAKLMEFRQHLDKFEEAATATAAPAASAAPTTTTTQPAEPAQPPPTEPTSQTPPTTQTPPNQPVQASPDPEPESANLAADQQELLQHVDAIEGILGAQAAAQAAARPTPGATVGTTGTQTGESRAPVAGSEVTLTQAQLDQLRRHLAELRQLIERK